jgi:hypothetical protein
MPLVEKVAAVLCAPLRPNIAFPAPLGQVVALDPSVFATLCVIPVVARCDDVALASRHLLIYRRRWRDIDNDDACSINRERDNERARNCDRQNVFRTFMMIPLCD